MIPAIAFLLGLAIGGVVGVAATLYALQDLGPGPGRRSR